MGNLKIKRLYSLLFLLFLTIFILFFVNFVNNEIDLIYLTVASSQFLIQKEKPITLIFVGDIMLNRGVQYMVEKYGKGDFKFPFLKIAEELQKADILFGNLESIISNKGKKVGSIYSFRAEPKAIEGLKFAGFNILSVANNHIFDYGREAMEDSFLRLRKSEIDYVGGGFNEIEAYAPVIKEMRGVKIAFLAYTNLGSEYWSAKGNRSGIAWLTEEKLKEEVKKVKTLKKNFIAGNGRRKTATARVFLWEERGDFTVNGIEIEKYFPSIIDQSKWVRPFHIIGVSHPDSKYSASIKVQGSGKSSQIDAVVLAIAKALCKIDPEFDKALRKQGLLTRDSRMVERKKPYLHKARKRPQYSKR